MDIQADVGVASACPGEGGLRPVATLGAMFSAALALAGCATAADRTAPAPGSNPIIRSAFTADPAPLVVGDTVYLYTSHDKATGDVLFAMDDWLAFSSKDLRHWKSLGPVMHETDFAWATATKSAWAAQAIGKDGKFFFYAPVK